MRVGHSGVQRAALSSLYLYSCLCHWPPHHREDPGEPSHACPYFLFKNKQQGGNSQTKPDDSPHLSGFSAKPHFMLRGLVCDKALRLPGRAGAMPQLSSRLGLTVAKWARGAAGPLAGGSFSLRKQAERGAVSHPAARGAHCVFQADGAVLDFSGQSWTSHLVNNSGLGPLHTDLDSNPDSAISWTLLFWTSYLTSPHLNSSFVTVRYKSISYPGSLGGSGGPSKKHLALSASGPAG